MANALSFLVLGSAFLGCAAYIGFKLGVVHERDRRHAIDASHHAAVHRGETVAKSGTSL
jgi:hypothetical protein